MSSEEERPPSFREFLFHSKLGETLKLAMLWTLAASPLVALVFMGGLSNPARMFGIWAKHWKSVIWLIPLISIIWAITISFFSMLLRTYLVPWIFWLCHRRLRYPVLMFFGFLCGALSILLIYAIANFGLGVRVYGDDEPLDHAGIAGLLGIAFVNMFAAFHQNDQRLRQTESRERELKRLRLEGELLSLNLRIRPHFFFNLLNTLAALIDKDRDEAQEFLADMADLFRLSFAHGAQAHLVRWADERRLVEQYLALEQKRFGERLSWRMEVEADNEAPFPAFLLQPLVENAVHHGLTKLTSQAELRIQGRHREGHWQLELENDAPQGIREIPIRQGHALESLHRRLALMSGELSFTCVPGQVKAKLQWQTRPAPPPRSDSADSPPWTPGSNAI